ncbi:MAG TPA: PadR family transcriptional regulator [Bryobacterales bacterium]|nr:PadR family transcriptional regulator [Bryobacterales bacterium]
MAGKPQTAPQSWSPEDATREVLLGFIRIHVLHHAAERPVYGLWLIEELRRHGYKLSAGTLYPILHGLESRGLLRCSPKLFEGKIRKYYAITPDGRRALAQMRRRLAELAGEVLPRR